jgi:DNA-binding XRE family transcriptional regulator
MKRRSPPRVEGRVRGARLERGLSQAELAAAAGLTRQAVYAIESSHYLGLKVIF